MGQHDDPCPQSVLVSLLGGHLRLGGPARPDHSRRPAFGDRERGLRMAQRFSEPSRAETFPAATSFTILVSSERSATKRFSRACSCSRPFSRLACSTRKPPSSFFHR